MQKIQIKSENCTLCGSCIDVCPFHAVKIIQNQITISQDCRYCGQCEKSCSHHAILIEKKDTLFEKEKWNGILVYIECHETKISSVSFELIGKAYELAQKSHDKIYAVGIGTEKTIQFLKKALQGYPLEKVFLYVVSEEFQADFYEKAMEDCIDELKPSIVLIGGTYEGRAFAPRAAVHYNTGLTADCTELMIKENTDLIQIRPAFGGNIMASIVTEYSRPQFATVRPYVMKSIEPVFTNNITFFVKVMLNPNGKIELLKKEKIPLLESITSQKIIVAAGRGIRKKEDLTMLEELADLLGGKLASSRALVEKGWLSAQQQIGLSGNTVCPDCIITCGISGTVQFMAGMKQAKTIIAINTDPNARIFEIAHYPICGDLYEIIPEFIQKLKG